MGYINIMRLRVMRAKRRMPYMRPLSQADIDVCHDARFDMPMRAYADARYLKRADMRISYIRLSLRWPREPMTPARAELDGLSRL